MWCARRRSTHASCARSTQQAVETKSREAEDAARARAKEIVGEARTLRERVLNDLTERRGELERQVNELRSGRTRLVETYQAVERALVQATRLMAEDPPVPLSSAQASAPLALVEPAPVEATLVEATRPDDGAPDPPSAPVAPVPPSAPSAPTRRRRGQRRRRPPPTGPGATPRRRPTRRVRRPRRRATSARSSSSCGQVARSRRRRRRPPSPPRASPPQRSPPQRRRRGAGDAAAPNGEEPQPEPVDADADAEPESEPEPEPDPGPTGAALLKARDDVLARVAEDLARRAKRTLQDEQNDVLDGLRRQRGKIDTTKILPAVDEQVSRWAHVLQPAVDRAYAEGAGTVENGASATGTSAPGALLTELARGAVEPLRGRLEDSLASVDTRSPADTEIAIAQALGARYREWRAQDLDTVLGDALGGRPRARCLRRGTPGRTPAVGRSP